jgi:hypothetical protein
MLSHLLTPKDKQGEREKERDWKFQSGCVTSNKC